ncbi:hypothetical protein [Nonomuraea turkmeniaca]|nr:hypothetical protein [Nonomuraea turkmeniaca]
MIEWFLQLGDSLNNAEVPISPDVQKVTGRPGRTFAQWAVDFR